MMISPGTYYEMYLKDKSLDEIMTAIRSLKREISRLKNIAEHPQYQCMIHPSEDVRISCNKDYLKVAKETLIKKGGIYIPTKAEIKIEEFDSNIPYINKIEFKMGGFFSGYETSSGYNYIKTPKYDDKEIGIKIKIKPKINPNGTVMLHVEEEYSQLGAGQQIYVDDGVKDTVDTALMRKMNADILLDNMQTVVLGGLTENYVSEKENGIPLLKDIPWVGKWLFGSVAQTESRKELLVFMTPYVLDDAEAAQAEAIRRKNSLSDPNPWDIHGWSVSELADPVSKKELLRRMKDQAEKQDQERANRIASEQWKLQRAKELEKLSQDELD